MHGEDAEGAVGQDRQDDGGDAADDAGELAGLDGSAPSDGPTVRSSTMVSLRRQRAGPSWIAS